MIDPGIQKRILDLLPDEIRSALIRELKARKPAKSLELRVPVTQVTNNPVTQGIACLRFTLFRNLDTGKVAYVCKQLDLAITLEALTMNRPS